MSIKWVWLKEFFFLERLALRVLADFGCVFPEDTCSYPTVSDLEEYVLNTAGKIWVGSTNSNFGRPWQFAQFSKDCLEVVLWIIEKMDPKDRGNPIMVGLKEHMS